MTRDRFYRLVAIAGVLALATLLAIGLLWRPDESADGDVYAISGLCGLARDEAGQTIDDR